MGSFALRSAGAMFATLVLAGCAGDEFQPEAVPDGAGGVAGAGPSGGGGSAAGAEPGGSTGAGAVGGTSAAAGSGGGTASGSGGTASGSGGTASGSGGTASGSGGVGGGGGTVSGGGGTASGSGGTVSGGGGTAAGSGGAASGGAGAGGLGAGGVAGGAACSPDEVSCGGGCVVVASDRLHCGACDTPCDAQEACVSGACVPTCASQLKAPVIDAWGFGWDGEDRASGNFPAARGACEAIGGRLPTATEIARVSAARTKQVGKGTDSALLWTLVPASPQEQFTARLSGTGDPERANTTYDRASRCVCPPPPTPGYDGHDCTGPNGAACATFVREGKTYAIDSFDRARLPVGAAEWECQQAGGALPPPTVYAALASSASGLGSGNGELHHAADQALYDTQIGIRWSAEGTWSGTGDEVSWSTYGTARPSRCVGPTKLGTKSAWAPAAGLLVPSTQVVFDAVDAPAQGLVAAVLACAGRGGHLPTSLGMFDAVAAGAGSGAQKPLWTSDFVDPAGATPAVGTLGWFDVAPRFAFAVGTNDGVSRQPLTDGNRGFRCAFYPQDAAYQGPDAADCQGGCTSVTPSKPAGRPRMWIDQEDRSSAGWGAANRLCIARGGRLPSVRDYLELMAAGLGGGSDAPVWTSDLAGYVPQAFTVRWKDTQPAWGDALAEKMQLAKMSEGRAYRCVFSDEVRLAVPQSVRTAPPRTPRQRA